MKPRLGVYINDAASTRRRGGEDGARRDGRRATRCARSSRRCGRLLKVTPINTVALRRQLADATVERRTYLF